MKKRVINMAFAIAFFSFGIADIITQQGSHIVSESTLYHYKLIPLVGARYTGIAAILEGLIFIGGGIFFFYRAWARHDDKQGSDQD